MKGNSIENNDNLKISLYQCIIILMAFFTTSASLFNLIPSLLVRNILAIFTLLIVIILLNGRRVNKKLLIYVLVMLLISIYNNSTISNYNIISRNVVTYTLYFTVVLMCCISTIRIDWVSTYLEITMWICCFYGIVTIIFYFTPNFYKNNIIPLFPYNADRLLYWYNSGSMPGLTSHYSTNAVLISIGIIILFSRIMVKKGKKRDYVLLLIMIIALIITRKRAHTVFVLAAMLVLYYFSSGKKLGKRIFKMVGAAIVVGIIGVLAYKYFQPFQELVNRFVEFANSDDFTNNRTRWWKVAFDNFKLHPIIGIGWGRFYDLCGKTTGYYANTHNVFLQLLCETGIVGFLVYMIWFVKLYFTSIKLYKNLKNEEVKKSIDNRSFIKKKYFIGFSVVYQTFFLLYCFTGNPLYDRETFIPYFVSCMISIYYSRNNRVLNMEMKNGM